MLFARGRRVHLDDGNDGACAAMLPTTTSDTTTECAVCLQSRALVSLDCGHPICSVCFVRLTKLTALCPLCRQAMHLALTPLQRADVCRAAVGVRQRCVARYMKLTWRTHAGITLGSSGGKDLVVVAVHTVDAAYRCGLRVGHRIVQMDGVRYVRHDECIAVIDRLTRACRSTRECITISFVVR